MNVKELQTMMNEHDHSLVAYVNNELYTSSLKGIAPIINPMKQQLDYFKDAIVVDKVIGKATAMLLIYSGVKYIYAYVLSKKAKEILDYYDISYDYDELVDYIVNRDHTGMCPMEQTVYDIQDLKEAYDALIEKQKQLQGK